MNAAIPRPRSFPSCPLASCRWAGRISRSVGAASPQNPETELYQPIHEFLDRILDPSKRKEPFGDVVEVTP